MTTNIFPEKCALRKMIFQEWGGSKGKDNENWEFISNRPTPKEFLKDVPYKEENISRRLRCQANHKQKKTPKQNKKLVNVKRNLNIVYNKTTSII